MIPQPYLPKGRRESKSVHLQAAMEAFHAAGRRSSMALSCEGSSSARLPFLVHVEAFACDPSHIVLTEELIYIYIYTYIHTHTFVFDL